MGWWRSYIRSKTKPMSLDYATNMKRRFAMAYLFCAWNAFALAVYYMFKEDNPKIPEEENYPSSVYELILLHSDAFALSKYYSRLLQAPDAKVLRFEGFKFVGEYHIEGVERPERGKTREQHEKEDREREEREREQREKKESDDLKLLVEETNSL